MTTEHPLTVTAPLADAARTGGTAALLGAATVHASVIGEHYAQWAAAGAFFLGLLVVETLLGVWLWRWPSRHAAHAVVVSGLLTVAVWAVSRTTGLPVGPADFRVPEPVGTPDVACVVLEQLAAILALVATGSRARVSSMRSPTRAIAHASRVAVLAVVVAVTALGLGSLPADGHQEHHHHGETAPSADSGD